MFLSVLNTAKLVKNINKMILMTRFCEKVDLSSNEHLDKHHGSSRSELCESMQFFLYVLLILIELYRIHVTL